MKTVSGFRQFTRALIFALLLCGISGCSFRSNSEPANTLHLVSQEKFKGLDPIYAEDLYTGVEVGQVYETLLQYHYLKRPYVLIPSLAESMPEVSADGKIYTFHLKKGVLFQDDPCFKATGGKGREMVATDFIYSIQRIADPRLHSSGWWLLDGKIAGLNAWRENASKAESTDYSQEIEGLKAIDRYTIQIRLTQRSAQFLYALAMPYTGVVPREAVETYQKEFINHAVGTGPFRLSEYNPNLKAVWVRNPTYRKELYPSEGAPGDLEAGLLQDAGKPLPLADRIVVQVYVEQQPMWLNFLSGKLDLSVIPKDNFASSITPSQELTPELKSKGIQLAKSPLLDVTHLTFNMVDPIIGKNKYLRQAMSLAYNEAAFIDLFYNGRAIPAQGPIPPGIEGYDPKFKNPYRQFNLAKAKELLAKAGYPGGKNLTLEYAALADSSGRQAAEFTQRMMAEIGIRLNISSYSWPQFLEVVKNKKAQIWEEAWGADYPDAENFLQLFYSKSISPGPNGGNYINPEFDHLFEKALTLADSPERTALYRKMVDLVVEDCPWIFGAHRIAYGVTQGWLKNYKPMDCGRAFYKYFKVEPKK